MADPITPDALAEARELATRYGGWKTNSGYLAFISIDNIAALIAHIRAAATAAERERCVAAYDAVESTIVDRYRVEQRSGGGFWPYCVKVGGGTMELFVGHKTKCEEVAHALQTACLDGAFMVADEIRRGT